MGRAKRGFTTKLRPPQGIWDEIIHDEWKEKEGKNRETLTAANIVLIGRKGWNLLPLGQGSLKYECVLKQEPATPSPMSNNLKEHPPTEEMRKELPGDLPSRQCRAA